MYFYFHINPSTTTPTSLTVNLKIHFNALFPHNSRDLNTPLPADNANLK